MTTRSENWRVPMNPNTQKFKTKTPPPPKTLTTLEAKKILSQLCCRHSTPKQERRSIRNWAMGVLMLEAGLRVGELIKLAGSDLMFNGEPVNTITLRAETTKTKTERAIPTSERVRNAIALLAKEVWSNDANLTIPHAFYQNDRDKPLSTRQVERIIGAAAMIAIGRHVHPHMLRHTFGTVLMRLTSPRVVQELLGHKELSSTQIYMSPNHQDLTDAIDKMENNHAC